MFFAELGFCISTRNKTFFCRASYNLSYFWVRSQLFRSSTFTSNVSTRYSLSTTPSRLKKLFLMVCNLHPVVLLDKRNVSVFRDVLYCSKVAVYLSEYLIIWKGLIICIDYIRSFRVRRFYLLPYLTVVPYPLGRWLPWNASTLSQTSSAAALTGTTLLRQPLPDCRQASF